MESIEDVGRGFESVSLGNLFVSTSLFTPGVISTALSAYGRMQESASGLGLLRPAAMACYLLLPSAIYPARAYR